MQEAQTTINVRRSALLHDRVFLRAALRATWRRAVQGVRLAVVGAGLTSHDGAPPLQHRTLKLFLARIQATLLPRAGVVFGAFVHCAADDVRFGECGSGGRSKTSALRGAPGTSKAPAGAAMLSSAAAASVRVSVLCLSAHRFLPHDAAIRTT